MDSFLHEKKCFEIFNRIDYDRLKQFVMKKFDCYYSIDVHYCSIDAKTSALQETREIRKKSIEEQFKK